jgi:biopolymer transport protein ExbD
MAEIIQNEGGGKHKGKRRAKKHSTHIDMTPMVDLFCLLLTFFMLTTAFSKAKVMEIMQPPDIKDKKQQKEVLGDKVLSIILDEKGKVFYYFGLSDFRKPPLPKLIESNFSKDGIRKVLLKRNLALYKRIDSLNTGVTKGEIKIPRDSLKSEIKKLKSVEADKVGNIVLLKATDKAKYGDFVNLMDEISITNIPTYAITTLTPPEKKMLEDYYKENPGN